MDRHHIVCRSAERNSAAVLYLNLFPPNYAAPTHEIIAALQLDNETREEEDGRSAPTSIIVAMVALPRDNLSRAAEDSLRT